MHKAVMGFRWSSASESIWALVVAAAFYAFGAILGGVVSTYFVKIDGAIVRTYFESFLSLLQADLVQPNFLPFVFGALRWIVLAFAFGFSAVGILCIPLLCLVRGFLFSFSIGAFACGLGTKGLTVVFCLVGLSGLAAIPLFLLSSTFGIISAKALIGKQLGGGRYEPTDRSIYCLQGVVVLGVLLLFLLFEWHFSPALLNRVAQLFLS